jgi:double zinc ribbon protein
MTQPSTTEVVCPSCAMPGTGRFCAYCGASLEATKCAGCDASLSPGAHFCHRCGRPVGAGPKAPAGVSTAAAPAPPASPLPWIVAAIALVCMLAFFAGTFYRSKRGSTLDAPQNALPQAGLDDRGQQPDPGSEEGAVRAPDISQMSPQERADRLFNKVMILNSQGKSDSVLFFAPMALESYRLLNPMNADQRYDMGRIAEVAGAIPLAGAQADTILQQNPTHLLGLILAARIAGLENDHAKQAGYVKRFLSALESEKAKKLPEYDRHQDDIANAAADARKQASGK